MVKNLDQDYNAGKSGVVYRFPKPVVPKTGRDPTSSDVNFLPGQLWVNKTAKTAYVYAGSGSWVFAGGAVQTGSAASANITLAGRVGQSTHTGLTTAAGSTQAFVITNSAVTSASQPIQISVDNGGSNDAQMSIQRVQLSALGTITVTLKNNGAAALNGDVHINWELLSA